MTRTPQTHETSATDPATGPLTAPVADVLPEHVLLRLLHDHCIASGDIEPDVELALQFASAIAAHRAVGEPILETPAFEGRDPAGDDDEGQEDAGTPRDSATSTAASADADAIDPTSQPHDSSEEDTLRDEFDAKLADEAAPAEPATETLSDTNENATDATATGHNALPAEDVEIPSDEEVLGELVGEAATETDVIEPEAESQAEHDPKPPRRGPQIEEDEIGALMAEMGGSGAEPGAEEEQQELKDVFGDPDEPDPDVPATDANPIAAVDEGTVADGESDVATDDHNDSQDPAAASEPQATDEPSAEQATAAPTTEVESEPVDDTTLASAAGDDSTTIAQLAEPTVEEPAVQQSDVDESAAAADTPAPDEQESSPHETSELETGELDDGEPTSDATTSDATAANEPAVDEASNDESPSEEPPVEQSNLAEAEADATQPEPAPEAVAQLDEPEPATEPADTDGEATASATDRAAASKTATDEEFALTNSTVDKVQDFLGDLKSALVEMAHRPQPTVDVEPLVEALQAGFDRSAEQAAQTSTAVASLSEHMTQFGRNIEGGVAKSLGTMQQSRQMSLGPGNGKTPEFVDDQGRSPAVVLGAISLIVLGWSILFWIKTGSPKLALGTLIGANAIACCLLLARRDRS